MLRMLLVLIIIGTLATSAVAGDAKVPLKTEFPEEMLVGTPPDVLAMLYPGLEKPLTEPPKFLVPKGTVNLALKKKVTATDMRPIIGDVKYVTDGKKAGSEDTYVELSPGPQWVQIDLGKPAVIQPDRHFFATGFTFIDTGSFCPVPGYGTEFIVSVLGNIFYDIHSGHLLDVSSEVK